MAKIIIIINDNLLLYQKKKEMWKQIKIIVITLKMKWKITFYFLLFLVYMRIFEVVAREGEGEWFHNNVDERKSKMNNHSLIILNWIRLHINRCLSEVKKSILNYYYFFFTWKEPICSSSLSARVSILETSAFYLSLLSQSVYFKFSNVIDTLFFFNFNLTSKDITHNSTTVTFLQRISLTTIPIKWIFKTKIYWKQIFLLTLISQWKK